MWGLESTSQARAAGVPLFIVLCPALPYNLQSACPWPTQAGSLPLSTCTCTLLAPSRSCPSHVVLPSAACSVHPRPVQAGGFPHLPVPAPSLQRGGQRLPGQGEGESFLVWGGLHFVSERFRKKKCCSFFTNALSLASMPLGEQKDTSTTQPYATLCRHAALPHALQTTLSSAPSAKTNRCTTPPASPAWPSPTPCWG